MSRMAMQRGARTTVAAFAAVAATALTATALTATASSAAVSGSPDLGAPTATATQHHAGTGPATLVAVRTGRHLDYDRVVFDLTGSAPGWTVGYVPRLVADPSGRPVPLRGSAILRVVLNGAQAHDENGSTTVRTPSTLTPELPTLRQVRAAGDFEAVISEGLGLRDRVGFRVFGLSHPTRVVVDVAHSTAGASGRRLSGGGPQPMSWSCHRSAGG